MSFLKGAGGPLAGSAGGAITPLSGLGQVGGPMSGISLFGNAMNGIAKAGGADPGYQDAQSPLANHLQMLDPNTLQAVLEHFRRPAMGADPLMRQIGGYSQ